MKVLHLITSLRRGGAERLVVDLAPRIRELGMDVRVLSMTSTAPLAADLQQQAVPVRCLGFDGTIYSAQSLLRLVGAAREEMRDFRPDIVHSHLYLADLVARFAAPKAAQLVTTIHNVDEWWAQRRRPKSVMKTWLDAQSAALRRTRAIAVSGIVASAACEALRLPQRRCRVVRNGIDEARFTYASRTRPAAPVVIQVGRFYPQKGHRTSLVAFKNLLERQPNCRLQLVGDGPDENALKEFAAQLGIAQRVDFMGPRADVAELLASAHVYWMPSNWEGLPLACLEAMATGLPVVASRVGGIPEFVRPDTGYLIDAGDDAALALETHGLLENYDHALERGRNASQLVGTDYTISRTARDYALAYSDIIARTW